MLVWITGGGYLNCDSANPHLAGDALAAAGAVVVSAHYRSGAEGFLRLDGAPDNRALLDQLATLDWVHANIAAFGGDPGNVTVFGRSAGAGSDSLLVSGRPRRVPDGCRADDSRRPPGVRLLKDPWRPRLAPLPTTGTPHRAGTTPNPPSSPIPRSAPARSGATSGSAVLDLGR